MRKKNTNILQRLETPAIGMGIVLLSLLCFLVLLWVLIIAVRLVLG